MYSNLLDHLKWEIDFNKNKIIIHDRFWLFIKETILYYIFYFIIMWFVIGAILAFYGISYDNITNIENINEHVIITAKVSLIMIIVQILIYSTNNPLSKFNATRTARASIKGLKKKHLTLKKLNTNVYQIKFRNYLFNYEAFGDFSYYKDKFYTKKIKKQWYLVLEFKEIPKDGFIKITYI